MFRKWLLNLNSYRTLEDEKDALGHGRISDEETIRELSQDKSQMKISINEQEERVTELLDVRENLGKELEKEKEKNKRLLEMIAAINGKSAVKKLHSLYL